MSAVTTWTVPGVVRRIVDADTLVIDLDLGWGTWRIGQKVRLLGIDAPEMSTAAGKAAREWLVSVLPLGAEVTVQSHALDSFGRVLGRVGWDVARVDLSEWLLDAGHAVPKLSA